MSAWLPAKEITETYRVTEAMLTLFSRNPTPLRTDGWSEYLTNPCT